ncbi:hypothetical protein AUL54_15630 [Bacillus sp. SDLI1]|nr:hypothetical protein AUL54_15630 [Bacillus sp. SDLI1]
MIRRYIGGIKRRAGAALKKAPHERGALNHYGPVPQLTLYSPSGNFFESHISEADVKTTEKERGALLKEVPLR